MHFQSLSMKSAKTTEKETRSCTGNPGFPMNHATAHKYYSYKSWLRIWNPGLFLILTEVPFFILFTKQRRIWSCWRLKRPWRVAGSMGWGHDEPAHTHSPGLAGRQLQCSNTGSLGAHLPVQVGWPFWREGKAR